MSRAYTLLLCWLADRCDAVRAWAEARIQARIERERIASKL